MKTENVEFLWDSEIVTLLHNEKLTGIRTRNVKTGEESTLACDGVFVSVGRKPSTELVKDQIEIDPAGYIIADEIANQHPRCVRRWGCPHKGITAGRDCCSRWGNCCSLCRGIFSRRNVR